MRASPFLRRSRAALITAIALGAGGGCIALGYDFDKQPPVSCSAASDCPGSVECGSPACEQGACTILNALAAGEAPPGQAIGDCKRVTCDGKGNAVAEIDEEDTPNDGNECTDDLCVQGSPTNRPSDAGEKCGAGAMTACNGVGACAGCATDTDCGTNTACVTWTCGADQTCQRKLSPLGTVADNPLTGDCKANLCDALGESPETFSPDDFTDDQNPCTTDACAPDFSTTHGPKADGAECPGVCQACAAGQCGSCAGDFVCDDVLGHCRSTQELPTGSSCSIAGDCISGSCVDGVCCAEACAAPCMACSNALTGAANGACNPVLNGTDPDNSCSSPAADVCVGGKCQCFDGIKNGTEANVDCGGNCAPCPTYWVCNGINGCDGSPQPTCCEPYCALCVNNTAECKATHGEPCAAGSGDKIITLGLTQKGGCAFNNACNIVICKCL